SRGTTYHTGGHPSTTTSSAHTTPQLVYSSASSVRSASGSPRLEHHSSSSGGADSPRGSWYGGVDNVRVPAADGPRRSWCEEGVEAVAYREWKGEVEVEGPLGLHLETGNVGKERRGAISPTVAPWEFRGY